MSAFGKNHKVVHATIDVPISIWGMALVWLEKGLMRLLRTMDGGCVLRRIAPFAFVRSDRLLRRRLVCCRAFAVQGSRNRALSKEVYCNYTFSDVLGFMLHFE